ncbi:MAG: UDP-glucose 6-dehydrogenase [Acidobacteria bacterium]|nr:MAG: UDP-glucose 6-dehydrogenase [Acidobacteriota bacterium]PYY22815.1 MAG: UDP-glucose 6-dehydrogenase [Acidobacteriota bacterium]
MKIAIVGSGYVGLVASACFAELGHDVICVDNDPEKLAALVRGETPIHEQYLPELLGRHRGQRLKFSASLPDAVRASSVVFVAVGTPPRETGDADLSYVEAVAREIAQSLNGYKVIVEKSTVPVYTSEWIRRVMQLTGAKPADFDVVSNPEFLREGTAVSDFLYPDRIVIGADSERAAEILQEIYAPLTKGTYYARSAGVVPEPASAKIPAQLILTSAKSAELIKHASNAFLALKISFINAVANVCEAVDADIEQVALGIGTDSRIGKRFLRAGIGYGGSCFPKDVAAFRSVARECGYDFPMLQEIIRVNDEQRKRFLKKVRTALWTLRGKRLAVLGLAYKGGTDDVRESPAIDIIRSLLNEQCSVVAYDPAATERASQLITGDVTYAEDPYQTAVGADALLILTDWEEFATLDLVRIKSLLRYPIVIDGRNLYSREAMQKAGLLYVSVGRATVDLQSSRSSALNLKE